MNESKTHSILSASSANRWIACPPSAQINATRKDESSCGGLANEGTCAHMLCEHKLKQALKMKTTDPTENLDYYSIEMEDCAEVYRDFCMEILKSTPNGEMFVEQRVDFSDWAPSGFGTADCLIVGDETLTVIDFKYGVGIPVKAKDNPQLMCYALGALKQFENREIKNVRMIIFQPRIINTNEWTVKTSDLLEFAKNTLSPAAKKAINGKGEFKSGTHCRFCAIKSTCRERALSSLSILKYHKKEPEELTDEEIENVLLKADELISWATGVKDYALSRALEGKKYKGFSLKNGRSVRAYKNPDEVALILKQNGIEPFKSVLKKITEVEKEVGRKKAGEILDGQIEKKDGKPVLSKEEFKNENN